MYLKGVFGLYYSEIFFVKVDCNSEVDIHVSVGKYYYP
jgi:hypothetical protein